MEMQSFLRSTGQNDVAKVSGNSGGERFRKVITPYQQVVETEQITQCHDSSSVGNPLSIAWELKLMLGSEEAGTQLVRSEAAPGCR
jgi:hypothetical protein